MKYNITIDDINELETITDRLYMLAKHIKQKRTFEENEPMIFAESIDICFKDVIDKLWSLQKALMVEK
ncbi:hypothetical protein HMPREF0872_03925 [Veillonella montpellierensis DNF00314]|uniref:Uncharacterized protein n=1 Tax=Veillonella montpellierensis DNF00314 TaxID=1401067 RepID=A0A096CQD5_9FIRM|nr:hypothetical protein [Veillonella montpellierensis]KGF47554.1 hypothetical protein HMPREF0872_03925 [Veillonella montpellierensis DNF00314]